MGVRCGFLLSLSLTVTVPPPSGGVVFAGAFPGRAVSGLEKFGGGGRFAKLLPVRSLGVPPWEGAC